MKIKTEELELSNKTKDRFFSIIAHDLRNPISALLNLATVFSDNYSQMSNNQILSSIGVIIRSARHTSKLLENLLD